MDDIFRIANSYYKKVESFNIFAMIKKVSFWSTLIFTICFLYFIFSFFLERAALKSSTLFTLTFGLAILSEIFMLFSMSELQKDKREYICRMMEAETGINSSSIVDVRISLLKKIFSCSRDKFHSLAQDIQNSLSTATLLSNDYSRIDRFFSFIYP